MTTDSDPLLPEYDLRKALYPCPLVSERLCQIARDAAPDHPGLAARLYRAALAFDGGCVEASLALAWQAYGAGAVEDAAESAERAHAAAAPSAPSPLAAEAGATLGWMQWEAGRTDDALATLTATLERHPDHATALWYLGHMQSRRGRFAEAEQLLRRALSLAPDLDEAAVTLAWVLADSGRLDDALALAHATARRAPQPHRLAQLGHLLTEKGETLAGIRLLEHAFAGAPDDHATRRRLATALGRAGRFDEARALIEEGLADAPDDRALHLAQALLLRRDGAAAQADLVARQIAQRWPDWAEGWVLLGEMARDRKDMAEALNCFTTAQDLDPSLIAAAVARSQVLLHLGEAKAAAWLMECVVDQAPDHAAARRQLAWALIGQNRSREARPHLHALLRKTSDDPDLWVFLSVAQHQMGRLLSARLMARRARRLAPAHLDALRHSAALAMEAGDLNETATLCHTLLHLAPDQPAAHVMASFAHQAAGRLGPAERHAEQAVALAPKDAEAWRCLGHLRHHQNRLAEAEDALHHAHALAPARSDILGQLAWVLTADDRLPEALLATLKACETSPNQPERWLERADILGLTGALDEAVAAVHTARRLSEDPLAGAALLARLLFTRGLGESDPTASWEAAASQLAILLHRDRSHHEAALVAVRLHAAGHAPAGDLVRLLPPDKRRAVYLEVLEWLAGFGNAEEILRLTDAARAAFPRDLDIEIACLYHRAMAGAGEDAGETARRLRQWGLDHGLAIGRATARVMPAAVPGQRLRVAYLASHYHHALLTGILAAHDPEVVALHLYTDDLGALPADLRGRVLIHPLTGTDLAASCAANRIDVVVDTVGLHPFHGQATVLGALRRRLAPVQCGWQGSWGPGVGLFDVLISDAVALPADADADAPYTEAIVRLDGGQWSWTPPVSAPPVAPLPALDVGRVTFGCAVRGFRLGRRCLDTWADLLDAVPGSRLKLLGRHGRDWEFRRRFTRLLSERGIDPQRVEYHFQRPYGDHLHFYRHVDIALDTLPANGGLCLPDALWMGVPVVTLAGDGLAAERQGASILAAADCGAWIADSPRRYVAIARALASDLAGLATIRAGLRDRLRASPLLDPHRIAAALERTWLRLRDEARDGHDATDLKEHCRSIARRGMAPWLERDRRLALPRAATPDISVVLVLYNQAGLSLQTLVALADQTGVAFETIIVDNASQDETAELLARVDGATILRNTENVGFLLAANQGAAEARGRHVLFLNNDAFLHRDALAAALRRLDGDPAIGVVGGRIALVDGTLQEAGCIVFNDGSAAGYGRGKHPDQPEFRFARDADFVSGAFLLIPRTLWQALGGFDTALAPAYYEDVDLCLRVRQAGFRVVYDPAVLLTHVEGGSAVTSDAAAEMMRRNRIPFLARHEAELRHRSSPATSRPVHDRWAATAAPRVLVIDNGVPHQAGGAGNPRARLMVRSLAGCHVTFFPLWTPETSWDEVYATLPAEVEVMLGHHASTLEWFLDQRRGLYDVMVVSRPPNMAFVAEIRDRRPELFAGARVVYDAEALFALREIGEAATKGTPLPRAEARRRLRTELDLAAQAECVLAVSEREARLFTAGGARTVHVLSHAMDCAAAPPPLAGRDGFLFVGALSPGTPNEDSLVWLVEDILPRLNDRLGRAVPVTIVGECRSGRIAALASDQVRLAGRADDLGPWYDRARAFIAPTRFAAGVPLKVIEAACAGIPVVATTLLVRQLGWRSGLDILAARDATAFAAAMAGLHEDADLWNSVRDAALRRAREDYAPDRFGQVLRNAVLAGRTP
ncbi:tetratricopeptide repeat protein [Novispirillum sp. DQ9]|uniref:tetratricopeptide repeat protein n=1 Tax=Novispirillum sp. DQ9 TaxID=3398612 RepID=UPI003C7BEB3D